MVGHEKHNTGQPPPRSRLRHSKRPAVTTSHDYEGEAGLASTAPGPKQQQQRRVFDRLQSAFCLRLVRRRPKASYSPTSGAPKLRFDNCHHEVHISGGPTPALVREGRRDGGMHRRATRPWVAKLDGCGMNCPGGRGGRRSTPGGAGGAWWSRASETSCCSGTPWASATNVHAGAGQSAEGGSGHGGGALRIYFVMEFRVHSEPRADQEPTPGQMQELDLSPCSTGPPETASKG